VRDLSSIEVNLKLPFISIKGTWIPNNKEQNAAWEMYVELITRISVAELKTDDGLLRESLSSLYTIFNTTREILRKYGPSIAKPKEDNKLSFGYLAVAILNNVLRPVLAKWHPLLLDYENRRKEDVSVLEHEKNWDKYKELRESLRKTRVVLTDYANLLAEAAGVPPLIYEEKKENGDHI
jgi:hypothetical protein